METKLFEVRDRMTFLPVICVKLNAVNEAERYLLAMTGYGLQTKKQSEYILMGRLRDGQLQPTPFDHEGYPSVRTLGAAHQHILKHWDELESGTVIDIEYIKGETEAPKVTQRLEDFGQVVKNIIEGC